MLLFSAFLLLCAGAHGQVTSYPSFSNYTKLDMHTCVATQPPSFEVVELNNIGGTIVSPCYPSAYPTDIAEGILLWHLNISLPTAAIRLTFDAFDTNGMNGVLFMLGATVFESTFYNVTRVYAVYGDVTQSNFSSNPFTFVDLTSNATLSETNPRTYEIPIVSPYFFSFHTTLAAPFTGFNISYLVDIDRCLTGDVFCGNDGICERRGFAFYSCSCTNNFTGNLCQQDVDECAAGQHNCDANADCQNTNGSFTCSCRIGYMGDGITCSDVNECMVFAPCFINSTCQNTPGSFFCGCNPGYTGNGVDCVDVNECALNTHNCSFDANCNNINGSYNCTCRTGFTGDGATCFDIDECLTVAPCPSNTTCLNSAGSFSCTCQPGFVANGSDCLDINECVLGSNNCDVNADCHNINGSFDCTCRVGYSGNGTTCVDLDECFALGTHNCSSIASCINLNGSFMCQCNNGFTGDGYVCADINECGTPGACGSFAECVNSPGSWSCLCDTGYRLSIDGITCTGFFCDGTNASTANCNVTGFLEWPTFLQGNYSDNQVVSWFIDFSADPTVTGITFTLEIFDVAPDGDLVLFTNNSNYRVMETYDFNITGLHPRLNFTVNTNQVYVHFVSNDAGAGTGFVIRYEKGTAACTEDPCFGASTCNQMFVGYECSGCQGFTGPNCENDVDECRNQSNPCHPEAMCNNTQGSYVCFCLSGFTGDGLICADIDECAAAAGPCGNRGQCMNTIGGFNCSCMGGFEITPSGVDCIDVDECALSASMCHPAASCLNLPGTFSCACNSGYAGDGLNCTADPPLPRPGAVPVVDVNQDLPSSPRHNAFAVQNPCVTAFDVFPATNLDLLHLELVVRESVPGPVTSVGTWATSIDQTPIPAYKTVALACPKTNTTRRKRSLTPDGRFVVGQDTTCDRRQVSQTCNGPLPPDRGFQVALRSIVDGVASPLTNFSSEIRTAVAPLCAVITCDLGSVCRPIPPEASVTQSVACGCVSSSQDCQVSCAPRTITNSSGFALNFPQTLAGLVGYSQSLCEFSGQPIAFVPCVNTTLNGFSFGRFDETRLTVIPCTSTTIAEVISTTNVSSLDTATLEETLIKLDIMTADVARLDVADTQATIDFINTVQVESTVQLTEFSYQSIVDIGDHLTNFLDQTSANQSTAINNVPNFVQSLTELGYRVQLQNQATSLDVLTPRIAARVENIQDTNVAVSYQPDLYVNGQLQSLASIVIPQEAIATQISGQNDMITGVFLVHTTNNLFPSNEPTTNNIVISGQVRGSAGAMQVANLQDPVLTTFLETSVRGMTQDEDTLTARYVNHTCVFWNFTLDAWSTDGCFIVADSDPPQCRCNHLTNFAMLVNIYDVQPHVSLKVVSYICIGLSMACLVVTLVVLVAFKDIRKRKPIQVLMNICMLLIVIYIIFMAGADKRENESGCAAVAFLLHYFLLCVWCWMSVYAVFLYRAVIKVFYSSRGRFLKIAAACAYGVPAVIATINAIAVEATKQPSMQSPVYGRDPPSAFASSYLAENMCWIKGNSLYFGFLMPFFAMLLFNIVIFVIVIRKLTFGRKEVSDTKQKKSSPKHHVQIAVTTATTLGLCWFFAFFMMLSDNPGYLTVMSWFFSITAGLQGVGIFLFTVVRKSDIQIAVRTFLDERGFSFCAVPAQPPERQRSHAPKYSVPSRTQSTVDNGGDTLSRA